MAPSFSVLRVLIRFPCGDDSFGGLLLASSHPTGFELLPQLPPSGHGGRACQCRRPSSARPRESSFWLSVFGLLLEGLPCWLVACSSSPVPFVDPSTAYALSLPSVRFPASPQRCHRSGVITPSLKEQPLPQLVFTVNTHRPTLVHGSHVGALGEDPALFQARSLPRCPVRRGYHQPTWPCCS